MSDTCRFASATEVCGVDFGVTISDGSSVGP